jgi:hypothetical protein
MIKARGPGSGMEVRGLGSRGHAVRPGFVRTGQGVNLERRTGSGTLGRAVQRELLGQNAGTETPPPVCHPSRACHQVAESPAYPYTLPRRKQMPQYIRIGDVTV